MRKVATLFYCWHCKDWTIQEYVGKIKTGAYKRKLYKCSICGKENY